MTEGGLAPNSLTNYLHRARALEAAYGDLDLAYESDGFAAILAELQFTTDDERRGRANPSRVPISSHLYKQLASMRTLLRRYAEFRELADEIEDEDPVAVADPAPPGLAFGFERDLQAALRVNLDQLEPGLQLADGGRERVCASGKIDILASDGAGHRAPGSDRAEGRHRAARCGGADPGLYGRPGRRRRRGAARHSGRARFRSPRAGRGAGRAGLRLARYRFSFTFSPGA